MPWGCPFHRAIEWDCVIIMLSLIGLFPWIFSFCFKKRRLVYPYYCTISSPFCRNNKANDILSTLSSSSLLFGCRIFCWSVLKVTYEEKASLLYRIPSPIHAVNRNWCYFQLLFHTPHWAICGSVSSWLSLRKKFCRRTRVHKINTKMSKIIVNVYCCSRISYWFNRKTFSFVFIYTFIYAIWTVFHWRHLLPW